MVDEVAQSSALHREDGRSYQTCPWGRLLGQQVGGQEVSLVALHALHFYPHFVGSDCGAPVVWSSPPI